MTADLHIHTNASDGKYTPEELVMQAREAGLTYVSITDHDTVAGLRQLISHRVGLKIIPGLELSTDLANREVHILAYSFDMDHPQLCSELEKIVEDRFLRVKKMVKKLNSLGYAVDYDHILEIAGQATSVGRPHVAKALVERGYFKQVGDAFLGLLEKNGPAYVPHYKMSPETAIRLVHCAGGIPVIAHPGLIGDDSFVLHLIQEGAKGLEVYHPKHDQFQTDKYLNLAQARNLLITGGSDFHGIQGRFPERLGEFTIPDALAVALAKVSLH